MPDRCQAKKLGLVNQSCRYPATMTLGDKHPAGLCDKCWNLYVMIAERNPEEAERIRKKVGMRDG